MRTPSTHKQLHEWWNRSIAGEDPPKFDGLPECGFYQTRLVKGGPLVPVKIYVTREIDPITGELMDDEIFRADCDGDTLKAVDIWQFVEPISRHRYEALLNARETDSRMRVTRKPLDLTKEPTLP